ncbi:UNVERIFIED_CONTAM: Aldehyde dehydrogenase [Sesamum calycinum]|uniref:Aldehyde dehydrogenase n=1 Tax=Sesamum calycinum TaxID=2727403 RepID=A0AAW2MSD3_9LAMI
MEGLEGLRRTFRSGRTRGVDWRKSQLLALVKFLEENEAQILEALEQDLGKHPVEAYRDETPIFMRSSSNLFRGSALVNISASCSSVLQYLSSISPLVVASRRE